jgi:hypothetical protein
MNKKQAAGQYVPPKRLRSYTTLNGVTAYKMLLFSWMLLPVVCRPNIQNVPGCYVNFLCGHNIGHSKQKKICMYMCRISSALAAFSVS